MLLSLALSFSAILAGVAGFSGQATYFEPGHGACGVYSEATDLIVAISTARYENGAHCYKHILVQYQGRTVDATIVDSCPGCGPDDVDLSPAAFSRLESQGAGRISATWEFL